MLVSVITDYSDTTPVGTAHTIFTTIEHGLNGVISVGIADSGAYGSGSAGQIFTMQKLVSGDVPLDLEAQVVQVQQQ